MELTVRITDVPLDANRVIEVFRGTLDESLHERIELSRRGVEHPQFVRSAIVVGEARRLGEGGAQTSPLGRSVVGGLAAATLATLFILPAVFAIVRHRSSRLSVSLDPDDPQSGQFISPVTLPNPSPNQP